MAQRQVHHTRIVWAPPALTRLKAVQSEIETLGLIAQQRMLTTAEQAYHLHLVRREEELGEEAVAEAKQRGVGVSTRTIDLRR
jgi:hypothetical protein